ncbi:MAG: DNA primase [Flavobacteriaceae bacterium]|nr:DNA primase [Flavobacteriaceae bacterium]
MKRVIVDFKKLTPEILTLLVEKYPDGYSDTDIITFKNAQNETVEAVEVRDQEAIYLVKVSTRLANRMENFEEEDQDDFGLDEVAIKDLDLSDEDEDDDELISSPKTLKNDTEDEADDMDTFDDDDDEYDDDEDEKEEDEL